MTVVPLKDRSSCRALARHHDEIAGIHLRDLFATDPGRGERLCAEAVGIFLDYSKNRVTDTTLDLLLALAEESGVAERRDKMFAGEHINVSEDRAVFARRATDGRGMRRSWSTGSTSLPRCIKCSTR